jgi:hypothetical protein
LDFKVVAVLGQFRLTGTAHKSDITADSQIKGSLQGVTGRFLSVFLDKDVFGNPAFQSRQHR